MWTLLQSLLDYILANPLDAALEVAIVILVLSALGMVLAPNKPPLLTSVPVALGNGIVAVNYFTLGLHGSSVVLAVNALLWGTMSVQEVLHPSQNGSMVDERAELETLREQVPVLRARVASLSA
jgi:hypothetical protein